MKSSTIAAGATSSSTTPATATIAQTAPSQSTCLPAAPEAAAVAGDGRRVLTQTPARIRAPSGRFNQKTPRQPASALATQAP